MDITVLVETEVFAAGSTGLGTGQRVLEVEDHPNREESRKALHPGHEKLNSRHRESGEDLSEGRLGLDIAKLHSLIEEQTAVLRRIEHRQAAADLSQQPIPEVPMTSSGTWGALLRSTVAGTIQPRVDKWRSILDTQLIFVALFSAIVAAFLVPSLTGLQQDKIDRTNELLANLTEIMIELSGANRATLNMTFPASFHPDAMNVRLNSYWSVSLILSLLVAVLAVTCRGWLNLVGLSHYPGNSMDILVDIQTRWKAAEQMLGPVIEMTPQLLIIPVLLFVVGLLDNIFSDVRALSTWPSPIVVALCLSLIFIAGVAIFMVFALVHAMFLRDHSPFQSVLARILCSMCKAVSRTIVGLYPKDKPADIVFNQSSEQHEQACRVYHEIVQATHDDETLDKAAAALSSVIGYRSLPYDPHVQDEECNTLLHLLSPEVSIRSNHTAAQVIVHLEQVYSRFLSFPTKGSASIMVALTHAARRSTHGLSLTTLWNSPFLKAMAVVAKSYHFTHPPVACILGSRYVRHPDSNVLNLLFDIFDQSFPSSTLDKVPPAALEIFKPEFIRARDVLESLHHLSELQLGRKETIISLLIAAKTPTTVISAAHELLENVNFSFLTTYTTIGLVVKVYLAEPGFCEEQLLGDLCVACVLSLKDHIDVVGTALFDFFTPFLGVVETAMSKLPLNAASPVLAALIAAKGNSIGPRRIARYQAEHLFADTPLEADDYITTRA